MPRCYCSERRQHRRHTRAAPADRGHHAGGLSQEHRQGHGPETRPSQGHRDGLLLCHYPGCRRSAFPRGHPLVPRGQPAPPRSHHFGSTQAGRRRKVGRQQVCQCFRQLLVLRTDPALCPRHPDGLQALSPAQTARALLADFPVRGRAGAAGIFCLEWREDCLCTRECLLSAPSGACIALPSGARLHPHIHPEYLPVPAGFCMGLSPVPAQVHRYRIPDGLCPDGLSGGAVYYHTPLPDLCAHSQAVPPRQFAIAYAAVLYRQGGFQAAVRGQRQGEHRQHHCRDLQ